MNKKRLTAGVLSLTLMALLALPLLAGAQSDLINWGYANETGLSKKDLIEVVNAIIKIVLGLIGFIAVVMIMIGGFQWMTAGGSSEKIDAAKSMITQGLIGICVIFLAYGIAYFVISRLMEVSAD